MQQHGSPADFEVRKEMILAALIEAVVFKKNNKILQIKICGQLMEMEDDSEAVGGLRPGEILVRQMGRLSALSLSIAAAGSSQGEEHLLLTLTQNNTSALFIYFALWRRNNGVQKSNVVMCNKSCTLAGVLYNRRRAFSGSKSLDQEKAISTY